GAQDTRQSLDFEETHRQLSSAGSTVGILLVVERHPRGRGVGRFQRRLWGWRLAVGIFSTQVAGEVVNVARGDFLRGGMGVMIAGALLFYLPRSALRREFH
ncbi:MAG: hypothetical protein QOF94_2515, partial [Acidobacteriaceae bacterium]